MSSTFKWRVTCSGAAVMLTWMLSPAIGHANALFADDFETGGADAWSLPIPARGGSTAFPNKVFLDEGNGVPNRFIVTLFAAPTASSAPALVNSVGGQLGYIYEYVIKGFVAIDRPVLHLPYI